jgi:hypothetical protein
MVEAILYVVGIAFPYLSSYIVSYILLCFFYRLTSRHRNKTLLEFLGQFTSPPISQQLHDAKEVGHRREGKDLT